MPVRIPISCSIETGVSLEALLAASRAAQEVLGRPLGSHLLTAGPVVWNG